ncbi:hypothetical protein ACFSL6_00130 [Paenibacillus thailandensis]|uniref:hypothetical protein n=1 Tax=Paenibacillus thailandensis TaxID=393250 RepID=UPI003645EEEB
MAAAANGGSLPDFRLASATSFLDWLGPLAAGSLVPGEGPEHSETGGPDGPAAAWLRLRGGIVPSGLLVSEAAAGEESDSAADEALAERLQASYRWRCWTAWNRTKRSEAGWSGLIRIGTPLIWPPNLRLRR